MKRHEMTRTIMMTILFCVNLHGQNGWDKNKLDDYLDQLYRNDKVMCGVVISKEDELIYEKYVGFSSLQDSIPISHSTRFRIGSITKIFTAAIIFQLIEEGRLTLDTPLSDFYPLIPNSQKITISHLLQHRSGIYSFTSDSTYFQYYTSPKTKQEILELIVRSKPDFQPDEKAAYSNTNYVLLGYIIEDLTHAPYPEQLKNRITTPLGLSGTYYGGRIDPENDEAFSYRFQNGDWIMEPETDMSIPHGAGAIVSTPRDLTAFITSLFSGDVVSVASLEKMKETNGIFGRGLLRAPFYERYAYGYNGGIDGFSSMIDYFENEKVAFALTSNGMNYSLNDISIGILSIYFNLPFEIPDLEARAIVLETENLKKYEGLFSSESVPQKITLKVEDNQLYGQPTGQSAFPLSPFSETEFRFEQAGIVIEFTRDDEGDIQYETFHLKVSSEDFLFSKD